MIKAERAEPTPPSLSNLRRGIKVLLQPLSPSASRLREKLKGLQGNIVKRFTHITAKELKDLLEQETNKI